MQETPRRSTRALFASKPGDGGGAATPSSGLLFLDASVNLASPSGVHGFPTSAQQQHRFRRGALFGGAAEGAASGDKGAALGAATLQAAFRGAARVKRHPKVATPHGCDPDAADRSAGPSDGRATLDSAGALAPWSDLYTLPHKRHGSPSSSPSTTSTRPSPNTSPSRSGRTPFGSSVDMTPFARMLRLGSGGNTPCSSPPGQGLLAPGLVSSTPGRRAGLHTGAAVGRRQHSQGGSPGLGPQDGTLASAAAHAASALLQDIHRPSDPSGTPVHSKRKRVAGRDDVPPERPQRPKLSEVLMRRHRMAALESDALA